MANGIKYQAHELLNKVLNAGEDALKVDIDNVTLDGSQLSVDIDNENDSIVIFSNTAADGSGTNTVPLVDAAGNLQIDIVSSALPSGGATAANQSTIIGHVDGVETLLGTIDADTGSIKTAVEAINQAAEGTISATTQRVTIATDDDGVAHLATIAGAVSTQMQVDVVASLPAGSAAIGKLAANSGVDIGDVDVTSIVPGYGATNLGKREDDPHANLDTGVMALAVRNDVLEALSGTDGDYSVLQVNKTGALNVTETVGHLGAHYESSTTANSSLKIVAFQFLEDTKFSVLTPATSAYIGNTGGGGDDVANTEVFPQGMTIFGRWTAFTLVSGGRVIAYLGDW